MPAAEMDANLTSGNTNAYEVSPTATGRRGLRSAYFIISGVCRAPFQGRRPGL